MKTNVFGTFNVLDVARNFWMHGPNQYKKGFKSVAFIIFQQMKSTVAWANRVFLQSKLRMHQIALIVLQKQVQIFWCEAIFIPME